MGTRTRGRWHRRLAVWPIVVLGAPVLLALSPLLFALAVLLDLLTGQDWSREQPIFFEHEGNSAIRLDNFKLVRKHGCDWELYDMDDDRTELNDLAGSNRRLEAELLGQYRDWADKTGVLDWKIALPRLLQAWKLDSVDG